jgi:hypothetical protein
MGVKIVKKHESLRIEEDRSGINDHNSVLECTSKLQHTGQGF